VLALLSLATLPITVSTFWKPADGAAPIVADPGPAGGDDRPAVLRAVGDESAGADLVRARASGARSVPAVRAVQRRVACGAPLLSVPRRAAVALRDQAIGWSVLYALFVVAMAALALRTPARRDPDVVVVTPAAPAVDAPAGATLRAHAALVADPRRDRVAMLLAVTNHSPKHRQRAAVVADAADHLPAHVPSSASTGSAGTRARRSSVRC
jgi:hypothetical protein